MPVGILILQQIVFTLFPFFITNSEMFVDKTTGVLNSEMCDKFLPCITIIDVCKKMTTSSFEVEVGVGIYEEEENCSLLVDLSLTGESKTESVISKSPNTALFILEINNVHLTLSNFTILLTNHSINHNFIRSTTASTNVGIIVDNCIFRSSTETSVIDGWSIYVNNIGASIILSNCQASDIILDKDPLVCTSFAVRNANNPTDGYISSLQISDGTFTRLNNRNATGRGTVFLLNICNRLTLLRCVFDSCHSRFRSGVGQVFFLGAGSNVQECVFSNCTAVDFFGVMYLRTDVTGPITFNRTSCVRCFSAGRGAFSLFFCHHSNCSYTDCWAQSAEAGKGGAVYVFSEADATFGRCAFVHCIASYHGGAIYFDYDGTSSISNTVFIGNLAELNNCSGEGGHDIYVAWAIVHIMSSCTSVLSGSKSGSGNITIDNGPTSRTGSISPCGDDGVAQCAAMGSGTVLNNNACLLPCVYLPDTSICGLPSSSTPDIAPYQSTCGFSSSEKASMSLDRILFIVFASLFGVLLIIVVVAGICGVIYCKKLEERGRETTKREEISASTQSVVQTHANTEVDIPVSAPSDFDNAVPSSGARGGTPVEGHRGRGSTSGIGGGGSDGKNSWATGRQPSPLTQASSHSVTELSPEQGVNSNNQNTQHFFSDEGQIENH